MFLDFGFGIDSLLNNVWLFLSRVSNMLHHFLQHSSPARLLLLTSLSSISKADEIASTSHSIKSQPRPPNVLFIVADDLGWNDVSWHNRMIHSPTMEQLAATGVLLDQYYVLPTCSPSRTAIMTGKYPYRVGRQHMYIKPLMPTGIPGNIPLMPQYFKDAGYTTHAIGKWHLGYCHQNYTPTYRGFNSFYGFYLGSQDYYLHNKIYDYDNNSGPTPTNGYDFRFNEKILQGPEVQGKYSADLFVKRAKSIFKAHQTDSLAGNTKPWFTYLSFQSVHDPLQVPHSYTKNVCKYKNLSRHFYSAMVSSLDHAIDQVVKSLKKTDQYKNTIIIVTSDNGGAVKTGGSNFPLRGTKGTLYEGGTRAIGFVHSPLIKKVGYTSTNLMHAVDWLPTLMTAIGKPGFASSATDGVDQWPSLSAGPDVSGEAPRTELVYNIKEKPFMAAIRVGSYKLIWGSRTSKDIWFPAEEEVHDEAACNLTLRTRSQASSHSLHGRKSVTVPRGVDTMDVLNLGIDADQDYWDEEEDLARLQEVEEIEEIEDQAEEQEGMVNHRLRRGAERNRARNQRKRKRRQGRQREKKKNKGGGGNKNKNKKGGGKNKKKNTIIPNNHGVKIRSWGQLLLFDLASDPSERVDLAAQRPDLVERLKKRVVEHYKHLRPRHCPPEEAMGDPVRWGGYYGPGWCDLQMLGLD